MRFSTITVALLIALCAAVPLHATSYYWTGKVSTLWSDPANWSPNGVPQEGDTLSIYARDATLTNDLPPGRSFAKIYCYAPVILTGNAIGIQTYLFNAAPNLIFNLPVVLTGSIHPQVNIGGGQIVFNNSVEVRNITVTLEPAHVKIYGRLIGSGTIWVASPGRNDTTLELYGDGDYTGVLTGNGRLSIMGGNFWGSQMNGANVAGTGLTGPLNSSVISPGDRPDRTDAVPKPIGRLSSGAFQCALLPPDLSGPLNGCTLNIQLAGTEAGTGYDQLRVFGTVTLQNPFLPFDTRPVTLSVTVDPTYTPLPGQIFTVIDNDGTDPVIGNLKTPDGSFAPEGWVFTPAGSALPFRLSYRGGDGNDVTLTVLPSGGPTTVSLTAMPAPWLVNQPITLTAAVAGSGGPPTGLIRFLADRVPFAEVPLSAGSASASISTLPGGPHSFIAEYDGDATFAASGSAEVSGSVLDFRNVRGDIDGDGKSDVIWWHKVTLNTSAWLMNGLNAPVGATLLLPQGWLQSRAPLAVFDVQRDGMSDMVWRTYTGGAGYLDAYLLQGATLVNHLGNVEGSYQWRDWTIVAIDDFDGDGYTDFVWQTGPPTGAQLLTFWAMEGFWAKTITPLPTVDAFGWRIVGYGDFDGDKKSDLLWRDDDTGDNVIWFMDGANTTPAPLPPVAPPWRVAVVADFDGDGHADILWRDPETGDNSIWLMNGSNVIDSATLPQVPDSNWSIATWGDYDGDGKVDLFWRNSTTGDNSIWLMNGTAAPLGVAQTPVYDPNWVPLRP